MSGQVELVRLRGRAALAALLGASVIVSVAGCTSTDGSAPASTAATSMPSGITPATTASPSVEDSSAGPSADPGGSATAAPSVSTGPDGGGAPQSDTAAAEASPPPVTVSTSGPTAPPGDINEVVAPVPVTTNAAVPFNSVADFGGQVTASLTNVTAIDATAQLPGEIAGPAVAITIEIDNASAAAIGLDTVTVDLTDGAGNPTLPMTADPAAPLSGVLSPGEKRSGVYVFTVPVDARNQMSLTVSYSTGSPTVLFTGSIG